MADEYSLNGEVYVDGVLLIETTQARYRLPSNDRPVKLLRVGIAGFSNGSHEVTIDFRNAIPAAGMERDYVSDILLHRTRRVSIKIGNKRINSRGRFTELDGETDVDNPNTLNLSFHGRVINAQTVT